MVDSSPDTAVPKTSTDRVRLMQGVDRLPQPCFAVIDGAQWSNLPGELAGAGLSGRSLFLGAGEATEAAGLWLVPLSGRPDAVGAVLDLVGDKPAAVFWGCHAGEAAL